MTVHRVHPHFTLQPDRPAHERSAARTRKRPLPPPRSPPNRSPHTRPTAHPSARPPTAPGHRPQPPHRGGERQQPTRPDQQPPPPHAAAPPPHPPEDKQRQPQPPPPSPQPRTPSRTPGHPPPLLPSPHLPLHWFSLHHASIRDSRHLPHTASLSWPPDHPVQPSRDRTSDQQPPAPFPRDGTCPAPRPTNCWPRVHTRLRQDRRSTPLSRQSDRRPPMAATTRPTPHQELRTDIDHRSTSALRQTTLPSAHRQRLQPRLLNSHRDNSTHMTPTSHRITGCARHKVVDHRSTTALLQVG